MTIPKPVVYIFFSIPWIAVSFIFIWLMAVRYPPSGIFVAETVLDGKNAWINPFLPSERVTPPGLQAEGWVGQRIVDDPTYFTARVPGPYETVEVAMEFKPLQQPLLEFGLVHDALGKNLELKPLYSQELESESWRFIEDNVNSGYVYQGISPKRLSDSDPVGIALWDASGTVPTLMDFDGVETETKTSLRGSHDFYFVPDNGVLKVTFSLQAVNRNKGSDVAVFRIYKGDEEVKNFVYSASGSREEKMGKLSVHEININALEPGVYRVSFIAQDDVFIRAITTKSKRWVVGPRVYFGDVVGYATTTYSGRAITNSRHVVAETFHKEGMQKIFLGDQSIMINRTHSVTRLDRKDAASTVIFSAPNGDVRIVGDGFFALRDEAYFEPKPRRLTDGASLLLEDIVAVKTSYRKPKKQDDGWYRAVFTFSLNPTLDNLRFVLSAPGIASRASAVDVRKITLTYKRDAVTFDDWWRLLRQELINAWHRL